MNIVDFIFSFISNIIIIYYFRKNNYNVLLLFPLFAFSGRWLASYTHNSDLVYYGYIEFILSLIILFKYRNRYFNSMFLMFMFPLVSVFSIFYIQNYERYAIYYFYFVLLLSANGYFALFLKNMKKLNEIAIIDKILIIWILLGIYFRISVMSQYNMTFLSARFGSSLWATNHISMIILLFLPLVKNKKVLYFSIFFLIIQFSRGVYATMVMMLIFHFAFVNFRKTILITTTSVLLIFAISFLTWKISPNYFNSSYNLFYERLARTSLNLSSGKFSKAITLEMINSGVKQDERKYIRASALEIVKRTNYMGIGLGSFVEGLDQINYHFKFSNAHNLYLTLLSEGGILFLVMFIIIMLKLLKMSYQYDRRVFVSLCAFVFYGLFSGQIYEASAFRSCIDYFYLIFIWAYLQDRKLFQILLKRQCIKLNNKEVLLTP